MTWFQNAAFYPTLLYNLLMNKFARDWAWYTRIDDLVVLGALPFKNMITELVSKEKIGGVVCLNMAYEVEHDWCAKKEDWEQQSVEFYWLPTPDFIHSPPCLDIEHAVEFIRSFEGTGKSVYVHCKAGRTRSATIAACYLIQKHQWAPNLAVSYLIQHRSQVILRQAHWTAINEFAKKLGISDRKTS